jgi:cation:H+ antiporter
MMYGIFGAGMLLLVLGSEALLHGGIGLGKYLGLSPLLIGLVVVSAATSAPELAVALEAVSVHPDIAIGCVIGGTIANILLVLGLGALVRPLPSPPKVVFRDGGAMLLASLALAAIAVTGGTITRQLALVFLGGFAVYLAITFITEWRRPAQLSATEARAHCRDGDRAPGLNFLLVAIGAAMVFVGARCLIDGGLALGQAFNLPQAVVGLTVVALATALPELVITITAFTGRYTDAVLSHIMAANVFNLLVVLGLVGALHPLALVFVHTDILVMAGAAALVMPLMIMSWRLSRLNGLFLMLCYSGYAAFLAWQMGYLHIPHGL